jgi:hypothetical protein
MVQWIGRSTRGAIIQRQPMTPYGLATSSSQKKYVDKAVDLWTNNKSMLIEDLANTLMTEIKSDLLGQGISVVKWKMTRGLGASGKFDQKHWLVEIDPGAFSSRDKVRKKGKRAQVQDLNVDEVLEVVGTLYHESRHIDQDVLIIRTLLNQGKSVDQVVKETEYPKEIVNAVKGTKFKAPVEKAQEAHAVRMYTIMYGAHNEFVTLLVRKTTTVAGVQELVSADSAADLKKAKPHVAAFETWTKSILDPKVKALKAITNASPLEALLASDLGGLSLATATLLTAFGAASKAPKSKKAMEDLQDAASEWQKKLMAAYMNLESEKDAFAVEGTVKQAFKTRTSTP